MLVDQGVGSYDLELKVFKLKRAERALKRGSNSNGNNDKYRLYR